MIQVNHCDELIESSQWFFCSLKNKNIVYNPIAKINYKTLY